ncbi:hypothetical protein FAI41_07755 [Acetobacteraceae bacterium]|nr:hypothetical protein FAI41_07755 [Acetobacteraceae bacterium]
MPEELKEQIFENGWDALGSTPISEAEIQKRRQAVANAVASFALEGFFQTEEQMNWNECFINGKMSREKWLRDNHHDNYNNLAIRKAADLGINPIKGKFDVAHLKALHGYIFQDNPKIQAGKFRASARGDWHKERKLKSLNGFISLAVYSPMDEVSKEKLLNLLKNIVPSSLSELPRERFVKGLAYLYMHLDYIHPFQDGNSRTLRAFMQQISNEAGYVLDWEEFTQNPLAREQLYTARDLSVNKIAISNGNFRDPRIQTRALETMMELEDAEVQDLEDFFENWISRRAKG